MDIDTPTALLAGLAPRDFMRRHWQKKPLLIRGATAGEAPWLDRRRLFDLASAESVESRLIEHSADGWKLRHGPFARRAIPPLARPRWTLLVQGVDLHLDAAHALMKRFRFVPDARLDDVMVSFATDGGGVGPHFDSYDVFLLQLHGRRRWRIGRLPDPRLVDGVPLKILANFEAEQEWLLDAGDMLYLPPRWAHDGIADGECMTCSIGFRAASRGELGRDLLARIADDDADEATTDTLYRDQHQAASANPARIPESLQAFAGEALERALVRPHAVARALGEALSEPKPQVWFDRGGTLESRHGIVLDRRTRMLYDDAHVFVNGESFRCAGRDATIVRSLADRRVLDAADIARLSPAARDLLDEWAEAGWLQSAGNPWVAT